MWDSVCPDKIYSFYPKRDGKSLKGLKNYLCGMDEHKLEWDISGSGRSFGWIWSCPRHKTQYACARMEFKESRRNAEYLEGK